MVVSKGTQHPLDFQYDPNKIYLGKNPRTDQEPAEILGRQVEALVKNDYFYMISKWEKLEACAMHNQAVKLDHYEVHAMFKVLSIYHMVNDGFSISDGLLDPTMDLAYQKVYTPTMNASSASFTAKEVINLCTVGGILPRPKPILRPGPSKLLHTISAPANRSAHLFPIHPPGVSSKGISTQVSSTSTGSSPIPMHIDSRSQTYAQMMTNSLLDFVTKALS